jgi:DNA-binding transcriptional ArsR family regulator
VSEKKPTQQPHLIDPAILKAQSHPLRASILNILSEGPSSPSRMHRRMEDEASLRLISYHCGILARANLIELIEERVVGNRTEHIYRTLQRQHFNIEEWMAIDPLYRDPIITAILKQISEDTGRAVLEGKFSLIPDSHLSRSPLEVDEKGWAEVLAALDTALGTILEAHAKSAERAQQSGEEKLPIRVVMMQFPIGREPNRK